jgi:hypothetical protein
MRTLMGMRRVLPTGRISFSLNSPQKLGLEVYGEFAYFVQKHGSTFGDGQQPVLSLIGAGERAFDVAEEFAFDQRGHERAAVYGDERLVVERSGVMNGARHHFLAGSAFAEDQDGVRTVGGFGNDAIEFLHLRSAAYDAAVTLLRFELLAQHSVFTFELEVIGDALEQELEFIDAEGFGHVLVGAILHGLHGRLHRAIAGHDDDEGFGALGLDVAESFQAARAGQTQIEQNGIDGLGLQQAVGMFGGIGNVSDEAQREGDLAASVANGTLVVDDEQVKKIGAHDLRGGDGVGYGS